MEAGDILLVRGNKGLALIQKALYCKGHSTHVLFGMGDGVFLHATSNQRVKFVSILDELKKVNEWRVIRLKYLSDSQKKKLSLAANFFLGQHYNINYFKPYKRNSSFCSELVDKIFARVGINLFGMTRPKVVSPFHFDKLADEAKLVIDVTDQYRQMLQDKSMYSVYSATTQLMQSLGNLAVYRHLIYDHFADYAVQLLNSEGKAEAADKILAMKEDLHQNRVYNFWHEKD